ncbi:zinc finger protein 354B-like isoform X1 [Euwallacea fornicatus]|uniref:zinc finger protein 354B-like isoform X1 n=1 Tax=Euwallacea fornicatus TaxID=995702 RepID=UPI00338F25C7
MEKVRCICCLNTKESNNFIPLDYLLSDIGKNGKSIFEVLEIVTSSSIIISEAAVKEICASCIVALKAAYDFIALYKESEKFLKKYQSSSHSEVVCGKTGNNYLLINDKFKLKEEPIDVRSEPEKATGDDDSSIYNTDKDINLYSDQSIDQLQWDERESHVYVKSEKSAKSAKMEDTDSLKEISSVLKKQKSLKNFVIMSLADVENGDKTVAKNICKPTIIRDQFKKEDIAAYVCDICNSAYDNKVALKRHKSSMHNPNWKEKFKCSTCNMEFQTGSKLRFHTAFNHKGEEFICYSCGNRYKLKQHLRTHIQRKHDKYRQKPQKFSCPTCGKNFSSFCVLMYHSKVHDNSSS